MKEFTALHKPTYHLTAPGASLYDFMDGLELELIYN